MEKFFQKRTLTIYWMVLILHCIFQFYVLPYRAVTKPFLVPLLLLHLMINDTNIGKPHGKSIFYIGLFLAFFGDVLLIVINDTFFLSGMIAFLLMNLVYSTAFFFINKLSIQKIIPFVLSIGILSYLAYWFNGFLGNEMGDYQLPILGYMISLSIMISSSINIITNIDYRPIAINWLIPGTLVFLIENILVALNKFHWGGNKDVYVVIMFTYGLAQYLIVKGIRRVYLQID